MAKKKKKPCPFVFRSKKCGFSGHGCTCGKTRQECLGKGNIKHYGGEV